MADQHQVLFRRKLDVDALRLEDHADVAAHQRRLARHIVPHDQRASARGQHQGRENAEGGGFAAAVGAKQAEDLGGAHIEGNAGQRHAVSVLMAQILELDHRRRSVAGVGRHRLLDDFRSCHVRGHR